jgi:hypothetical protein
MISDFAKTSRRRPQVIIHRPKAAAKAAKAANPQHFNELLEHSVRARPGRLVS